jgi:hypothetical protein
VRFLAPVLLVVLGYLEEDEDDFDRKISREED